MSTPADWERIEELGELATPRPWFSDGGAVPYKPRQKSSFSDSGASVGTVKGDGDIVAGGLQDEQGGAVGVLNNEDADYIVATSNAAPDMARRLRRLRELLLPRLKNCEGDVSRELLKLLEGTSE